MACVVRGCRSHSSRIGNGHEKISFHKFPLDEDQKQIWLTAINRPSEWIPKKHSRVCSRHFKANCFLGSEIRYRRLQENAVPTLCLPDPSDILYPPVLTHNVLGHNTTIEIGATSQVIVNSTPESCYKCSENEGEIQQLRNVCERLKRLAKRRMLRMKYLRQFSRRLNKKNVNMCAYLVKELEKGKSNLRSNINAKTFSHKIKAKY